MKKRIIALLLAVAAVMSMIVVPVSAYDTAGQADVTSATGTCPCGCGLTLDNVTWKPWNPNENGDPASGHYYLEGNYAQDAEVNIISGFDVVLDLRGYTLTTASTNRLLLVNGHMVVLDTVGGGRLSAMTGTAAGGVVKVAINETADPTFDLYSGTITPDAASVKTPSNGSLVYVTEGSHFNMYGGTLLGGKSSGSGGSVYVSDATVNITGGSIIGGTAGRHGGNIYATGSSLTLKNCQIIGGRATGWGGNIYLTGSTANLSAENCVFRGGIADCDDTVSANNNGGGNICALTSSTSSFINCTVTGGYSAKHGGNLYLGSGKHTFAGGKISGGTAGMSGNNLYGTGNVTLDGCTVAGDVEYNSTNALTLKGDLKIGLLNTGLNIANTGAQVNASGLTGGAEIYLNADGVTLANASMDYFKPAIRTLLTQDGTSITTSQAADGETAGYCPHCDEQVAWSVFDATGVTTTGGHYYCSAATSTSQLAVGRNITDTSIDTVVDLNGYTVTASGRFAYIYDDATTGSGHTLSVMDSAGNGKITGKGVSASYFQNGGVVYNEENFNLYGGKLVLSFDADRGLSNGGVVYNGGVFNMYGGVLDGSAYNQATKDKITENDDGTTTTTATNMYGGALYMGSGSSRELNMSAGHIIGGTANCGGSLYFNYNNVVNITGGSIADGRAHVNGGNIAMQSTNTGSSYRKAAISISGCSIIGGRLEQSTATGGGNIYAGYGTSLDLDDCYIADGYSKNYAGNLVVGSQITVNATNTIIMRGSSAKQGGNIHSAGTSAKLNLTNSMVTAGQAGSYGGNISAGNGYITITGGEISYGTATTYGGNLYANAGNYSATSDNNTTIQADEDGNAPLIVGGTAGTTGGNIYISGVLNLTAALLQGGQAGTYGQDFYLAKFDKQQLLAVGSGVTGSMLLYVEESTHLTDPVYGTAILKTACGDTLNASIYLENDGYGQPMLIAENGALCVGAIAVRSSDGTTKWFTTADAAMGAYEVDDVLLLATDCEVNITQDCIIDVCGSEVTVYGNYKVTGMDSANDDYTESSGKLIFADQETANTDAVTSIAPGSMYVAVSDGNEATFHRLDFGIESISIRPTSCGIYYTGVWSCDEVLAEEIDSYGIALSLKSMPTANFIAEEDSNGNMWTAPKENLGVGVNSTSVLVSGIMAAEGESTYADGETPVSATLNSERGKRSIYATAYVTIDGETYISDDSATADDDVDYSLYTAMELMDNLITTNPEQFRRYTNAMRAFYDIWDEFGMDTWDFEQVYIPAEDDVIDVLMIGSSFCYYYVEELAQLAAAAGVEMRVCNVYYSGCKLYQHYNWWVDGQSNYQFFETTVTDGVVSRVKTTPVSLEWCLAQGEWDVISLQESSSQARKSGTAEAHFENTQVYHETLIPYLQEQFPQAQFLWQQTWAYQIGYDRSGYQMLSLEQQAEDTQIQVDFGQLICAEYGVQGVPSGTAWMNVRNGAYGDAYDNLCARLTVSNGVGDYYHDGDIGGGQYLNACVWFEMITGLDCREIDSYIPTYEYSGTLSSEVLAATKLNKVDGGYALTKEFVDLLQESAHAAVESVKNQ